MRSPPSPFSKKCEAATPHTGERLKQHKKEKYKRPAAHRPRKRIRGRALSRAQVLQVPRESKKLGGDKKRAPGNRKNRRTAAKKGANNKNSGKGQNGNRKKNKTEHVQGGGVRVTCYCLNFLSQTGKKEEREREREKDKIIKQLKNNSSNDGDEKPKTEVHLLEEHAQTNKNSKTTPKNIPQRPSLIKNALLKHPKYHFPNA